MYYIVDQMNWFIRTGWPQKTISLQWLRSIKFYIQGLGNWQEVHLNNELQF